MFFSAPILVAATMKPEYWELREEYAQATTYIETEARLAGVTFREESQMWSQLTAYSTAGHPFAYNDDDRCGGLAWHWDRELLRSLYFSSIAFESPETQIS